MTTPGSGQFNFETNLPSVVDQIRRGLTELEQTVSRPIQGSASDPFAGMLRSINNYVEQGTRGLSDMERRFEQLGRSVGATQQLPKALTGGGVPNAQLSVNNVLSGLESQAYREVQRALSSLPQELGAFGTHINTQVHELLNQASQAMAREGAASLYRISQTVSTSPTLLPHAAQILGEPGRGSQPLTSPDERLRSNNAVIQQLRNQIAQLEAQRIPREPISNAAPKTPGTLEYKPAMRQLAARLELPLEPPVRQLGYSVIPAPGQKISDLGQPVTKDDANAAARQKLTEARDRELAALRADLASREQASRSTSFLDTTLSLYARANQAAAVGTEQSTAASLDASRAVAQQLQAQARAVAEATAATRTQSQSSKQAYSSVQEPRSGGVSLGGGGKGGVVIGAYGPPKTEAGFEWNPNKTYRALGQGGYDALLREGSLGLPPKSAYDDLFFNDGFPLAKYMRKGPQILAEVDRNLVRPAANRTPESPFSVAKPGEIPASAVRVLQVDRRTGAVTELPNTGPVPVTPPPPHQPPPPPPVTPATQTGTATPPPPPVTPATQTGTAIPPPPPPPRTPPTPSSAPDPNDPIQAAINAANQARLAAAQQAAAATQGQATQQGQANQQQGAAQQATTQAQAAGAQSAKQAASAQAQGARRLETDLRRTDTTTPTTLPTGLAQRRAFLADRLKTGRNLDVGDNLHYDTESDKLYYARAAREFNESKDPQRALTARQNAARQLIAPNEQQFSDPNNRVSTQQLGAQYDQLLRSLLEETELHRQAGRDVNYARLDTAFTQYAQELNQQTARLAREGNVGYRAGSATAITPGGTRPDPLSGTTEIITDSGRRLVQGTLEYTNACAAAARSFETVQRANEAEARETTRIANLQAVATAQHAGEVTHGAGQYVITPGGVRPELTNPAISVISHAGDEAAHDSAIRHDAIIGAARAYEAEAKRVADAAREVTRAANLQAVAAGQRSGEVYRGAGQYVLTPGGGRPDLTNPNTRVISRVGDEAAKDSALLHDAVTGAVKAYDAQARAAQRAAAAQSRAQGDRTVGGSFIGGLTAGRSNEEGFDVKALARRAGTVTSVSLLYRTLGLLQGAIGDVQKQYFDFVDSQTAFNAAMGNGNEATQSYINTLSEFSRQVGSNVGEALDTATRGVAAFSNKTKDSLEVQLQNGAALERSASQLSLLSGKGLTDQAGDIIAVASSFGLAADQIGSINDAVVNAARNTGRPIGDISQGLANIATSAQAAGLDVNEAANMIALVMAKTDEAGATAATRLTRIFAIIGGQQGQNAIAQVNQLVSPAAQVDTTKPISDQIRQLASAYQELGAQGNTSAQARLREQLGGTANIRELLPLLQDQDQLQRANDASANGAGAATEAYQRRLGDITGVVKTLSGTFKALAVDFANTGVFDLLILSLKLLSPLLQTVDRLLESFNDVLGGANSWISLTTFGVLELVAAYRLFATLSRMGAPIPVPGFVRNNDFANRLAGGGGFAGAGRGAARDLPTVAEFTDTQKNPLASTGLLAANGGIATPQITALQQAEQQFELSLRNLATVTEQQAALVGTAAEERVAAEQAVIAAVTGTAAAQAQAAAALATANTAYEAAVTQRIMTVGDAEAESRSARGAMIGATEAATPSRALSRAIGNEYGRIERAGQQLQAVRMQNVASQGAFNKELQAAEANELRVRTEASARIAGLQAGTIAPGGLLGRAGGGIRSGLGAIGLSPLGGALAIGGAALLTQAFVSKAKEIEKLSDEARKQAGTGVAQGSTREATIENVRKQNEAVRSASSAARASDDGLFSGLVDKLTGDNANRSSDQALEQSRNLTRLADTLQAQQRRQDLAIQAAKNPKDLASQIDLSNADAFTTSIEKVNLSAKTAQGEVDALNLALENLAKNANGATPGKAPGLTADKTLTYGMQLGSDVSTDLNSLLTEFSGQGNQNANILDLFKHPIASFKFDKNGKGYNPYGLGKNDAEDAAKVLRNAMNSGAFGRIGSMVTDGVAAVAAEEGGKLDGSKETRQRIKDMITAIVLAQIPDFKTLPQEMQDAITDRLGTNASTTFGAVDPNAAKVPVDAATARDNAINSAKARDAAAQGGVSQAQKALDAAYASGDARKIKAAQDALNQKADYAQQAHNQALVDIANANATYDNAQNPGSVDTANKAIDDGLKVAQEAQKAAASARALGVSLDPATGAETALDPKDRATREGADLTGNRALLANQEKTRADALAINKNADTKQIDEQIRETKIAVANGVEAYNDSMLAITESAMSPFDKSGRLAAQINELRDKMKTETDDSRYQQELAQYNDLLAQQVQQATRDADAKDSAGAAGKGSLTEARAASGNAKRDLDAITKSFGEGTATGEEYYNALSAYQRSLDAVNQAQLQAAQSANQLAIDLTDPVQAAADALKAANDKLNQDAGKDQGTIDTDTVAKRRAETQQQSAEQQQWLTDLQNSEKLGSVSHATYIDQIKGRRAQLAAELATMKTTDNGYRQIKDEITNLDLILHDSATQMQGAFNIGNVKLPTLYQVRRFVAEHMAKITNPLKSAASGVIAGLTNTASPIADLQNSVDSLQTTNAVTALATLQGAINGLAIGNPIDTTDSTGTTGATTGAAGTGAIDDRYLTGWLNAPQATSTTRELSAPGTSSLQLEMARVQLAQAMRQGSGVDTINAMRTQMAAAAGGGSAPSTTVTIQISGGDLQVIRNVLSDYLGPQAFSTSTNTLRSR